MASPKVAPARVDCTRCETPTAAPAKRRPGPKAVQKVRVWAGAFTGVEVDKMQIYVRARGKGGADRVL
jgi:hypothetical protein